MTKKKSAESNSNWTMISRLGHRGLFFMVSLFLSEIIFRLILICFRLVSKIENLNWTMCTVKPNGSNQVHLKSISFHFTKIIEPKALLIGPKRTWRLIWRNYLIGCVVKLFTRKAENYEELEPTNSHSVKSECRWYLGCGWKTYPCDNRIWTEIQPKTGFSLLMSSF